MNNEKKSLFYKIYDNLEAAIGCLFLIVSCIILTWQVFTRYVLGNACIWSEEVARYMFVWVIFLACSFAMKTDDHIRVDFAINVWPAKIRKYVMFVGDLLSFALAGIVLYYGVKYCISTYKSGQFGAATFFPVWIVWAAVPVTYVLMITHMINNFISKYFRKKPAEPAEEAAAE